MYSEKPYTYTLIRHPGILDPGSCACVPRCAAARVGIPSACAVDYMFAIVSSWLKHRYYRPVTYSIYGSNNNGTCTLYCAQNLIPLFL